MTSKEERLLARLVDTHSWKACDPQADLLVADPRELPRNISRGVVTMYEYVKDAVLARHVLQSREEWYDAYVDVYDLLENDDEQ